MHLNQLTTTIYYSSTVVVVATGGANLCILRVFGLHMSCYVLFLWRYDCFVLFRFLRLLFDFAAGDAAAIGSIVLRCACAPTATGSYLITATTAVGALFRSCFFLSLERSLFTEYICAIVTVFTLYGVWYVVPVRFFLPDDGVFLPCDHGLDFRHQVIIYVRLLSINRFQSTLGPLVAHNTKMSKRLLGGII